MKWFIVTCDASAHIRPVQEWLFKKYAPDVTLHYLDVHSDPVRTWGRNVIKCLNQVGTIADKFVVFGLDDYLPTSSLDIERLTLAMIKVKEYDLDRFELGHGAHNKLPFTKGVNTFIDHHNWLAYGTETPYSVSCQFAIWKLSRLREILSQSTDPWNFETKHKCWAGCFPKGQEAFRWIEESALSKRWKGQINVNGLNPGDVNELIGLGLLDESKLINRV